MAQKLKNDDADPLDNDLIDNLRNFKGISTLKKAAMNLFVKTLNAKEIAEVRKTFESLDQDQTGKIDAQELANALKKADVDIPSKQIEMIIKEIDYAGNGQINYSEFLAATMTTRNLLNENRLLMLFKEFDTDDTGYITRENLVEAFEKLERPLSKKEIEEIISQHDGSKDGKISYDEFKTMMLGEENDLIEIRSEA